MQLKDLKPAGQLAGRFGVKALVYGEPGLGKTPLSNTAPRPMLLATEPGLLSMRDSTVMTWEAYTPERLDEFFEFFFNSKEIGGYDTLCIDSISQMAEIYLRQALNANKDGRMAYGKMCEKVMEKLNKLYFFPQKHLYLICKREVMDMNGTSYQRPAFPGKELHIQVPHLFDEILHLGLHQVPQVPGPPIKAFCTASQYNLLARDRSGRLNTYEPPNLTDIFNKAMV